MPGNRHSYRDRSQSRRYSLRTHSFTDLVTLSMSPKIALVLILAVPQVAYSQEQNPDIDDGHILFYEYLLTRLGEEKMRGNCPRNNAVYRLVEISPRFTHSSIRVSLLDKASTVQISRFELPDLLSQSEQSLDFEAKSDLEATVSDTDYWALDSDMAIWSPDRTYIYIEGCLEGRYHIVKRAHPSSDIAALVEFFASIT